MATNGKPVLNESFFKVATGEVPYPYEIRLASSENFPKLLKIPTGPGKTAAVILAWLWRRLFENSVWVAENSDNRERVVVSVLIGGEEPTDWALWPERNAILIGTQDMLLSRALNCGYGASRSRWPIQFGLLNTACLWIFDEIQLMGAGLATTAQLEPFRRMLGVHGIPPLVKVIRDA